MCGVVWCVCVCVRVCVISYFLVVYQHDANTFSIKFMQTRLLQTPENLYNILVTLASSQTWMLTKILHWRVNNREERERASNAQ